MAADTHLSRDRDRFEIRRLAHEHEVWRGETDQLLARARIGPGDRVVELGCGPGFLTLDLALLVGPDGLALGLDGSDAFIDHLERRAEEAGLESATGQVAELASYRFEPESFDAAVCRWVLTVQSQPETLVARLARALKPGGVFLAVEHGDFGATALHPDGRAFRRLCDAADAAIRAAGGDPDVGAHVPDMATRHGLEVVDIVPIIRTGRPGTPLWDWLAGVSTGHLELVAGDRLSGDDVDAYRDEWTAHAADPGAFFTTPLSLATLARKA